MYNMRASSMNSTLNGTMQGIWPEFLMADLQGIRAKSGRMILKMHGGPDEQVQNSDGTFSLAKWKALADRFRKYDFSSYIADGTLMGHFLIDEPEHAAKWGGKTIPHATVEEMARYSKQIWPDLATIARTTPSWLAKSSINYVYLDAGWVQYVHHWGDIPSLMATEVAAAKRKGLGVIAGLNILDGGDGSSGLKGWLPNHYMMTATEIRNHGNAIMNESYICAFLSWTYIYQGTEYVTRPDVDRALTELANKAKAHARTSCRQ
jgi:hypothetical protein